MSILKNSTVNIYIRQAVVKARKRINRGSVILLVAALLVGLTSAVITYKLIKPDEWRPLGPYPVQPVTNSGPRIDSLTGDNSQVATVDINGTVKTSGVKCAKEEVLVTGILGWHSVYPGGFVYEVPQPANKPPAVRLIGCSAKTPYENHIPIEVREYALGNMKNGIGPEFIIGGCEIPQKLDSSGKTGERQCWRTERFILVDKAG